jgi:Transposase, Mutator family
MLSPASRESVFSWKELLNSLRQRSLKGVEFVVSDDHAGLRRAIQEVLPEAVWQRCYVHFLPSMWILPPQFEHPGTLPVGSHWSGWLPAIWESMRVSKPFTGMVP